MFRTIQGNGAVIKNDDLFKYLLQRLPMKPMSKDSKDMLYKYILEVIDVKEITTKDRNSLRNTIHSFCVTTSRNWQATGRDVSKFKTKHNKWLSNTIIISKSTNENSESSSSLTEIVRKGRPKQSFQNVCEKTKRRRLNDDVRSKSEEEIFLAAEMKLHSVGKRKTAQTFKHLLSSPEQSSSKLPNQKQNEDESCYSPEKALALFTELKLTRQQYIRLRKSAISKNFKNLYPPYNKLLNEKQKCYPSNVIVTDILAEVPVQSLVDHTVSRIAKLQSDVLMSLNDQDTTDIQMFYKWGADGSGSQSNYKQKFDKEDSDDSNILIFSLVPLRLFCISNNQERIIWQNLRPNSTRFCRPIKLQFVKETTDTIKAEFILIENQITSLIPTKINISDKTITIRHNLLKTMIDGKIANALESNKSTQTCYICKAPQSQFNKLVNLEPLPYDPKSLDLGISPLHALIRFFECLLHIAYKLPIRNWQARGKENKKLVEERKKHIQEEFKKELHLLVDVPKHGFGNTNDGNTARAFFSNIDVVHRITGIDIELIKRFDVILKTLNCPFKINSQMFDCYAKDTAKLFIRLYGWYHMTPTVHKVLTHGKDIIDHFLLPIGQLGEDAQECRHKDVRYYREHNTRKMSRKETNEDLFKILLVSSDPIISYLRPLQLKQRSSIPQDVLNLLEEPNFNYLDEE